MRRKKEESEEENGISGRTGNAGYVLETAGELGKDAVAIGVEAASILTPVVLREAARWAFDRMNYDGWFEEAELTTRGGRYANESGVGVLSGLVEVVEGAAILIAGAAVGSEGGSYALVPIGIYAIVEGAIRAGVADTYTSTLPVSLASHGVQAIGRAAKAVGNHVSKRYDEVVTKHEADG